MRIQAFGAAFAATLALATPALAQRSGGGASDPGNGLVRDLHAGNDRTAGVRAGAGRVYGGYMDGYYGAYYGTRDPGPLGAAPGWGPRGYPPYP